MRAIFGVLSLLIVVAVVGVLVKKQLVPAAAPASAGAPSEAIAAPVGTPQQQVKQYQQAIQGAMQQPARPMPEEK
jgi:Na+-transporting methylmalonyl-CoA/oxaloacetate decarboxylase gamma subunit